MLFEQIERQIDPIFRPIDRHILPEVGELKRGAGGIRQFEQRGVTIAAQAQHQAADRIGGIAAILEHIFKSLGNE